MADRLDNTLVLLPSTSIDKDKWDNAIRRSSHSRNTIYAMPWYLDLSTSNQWKGLIKGDYELVIPLPSFFHFRYLKSCFRPSYSQQLGIYGGKITKNDFDKLLNTLTHNFDTVSYPLPKSQVLSRSKHLSFQIRKNLILNLKDDYLRLSQSYSKSLKRRLKKAELSCLIKESHDVEAHISFYKNALKGKVNIGQKELSRLSKIISYAKDHKQGIIVQVFEKESKKLICSAFFLVVNKYIINLAGASSGLGMKLFGMHLAIDTILRKYAGTDMILDMEGSDIEGVYSFFKSFGCQDDPYIQINKHQAFPDRVIRMFKKIKPI